MRAPKRANDNDEASDVGVNDLGDGGAEMRVLRCNQSWEAEEGNRADTAFVSTAGGRQD